MNKKLEWVLVASVVAMTALAAMDLALGKWIDTAGLLLLAFSLALQWVTQRKLAKGYRQQLASMQFGYGDLIMTEAGERGMVISDHPATGWVSVVIFKNDLTEQAAVYNAFDLVKTS